MRRKRRSKGVWFPVLPTIFSEGGAAVTFDRLELQAENASNPAGGRLAIQAVGLVPDFTDEPSGENPGHSLRDLVEGQDWLCRRVVGKLAGGINWDNTGAFRECILGVGLAVLPVDDDEATQGAPALAQNDYDPLLADNSGAPWMWRRTWLLRNPSVSSATLSANAAGTGNYCIEQYGSVMDGGHLDCKSVRRITREQRLFLVASAYSTIDTTGITSTYNTLWLTYDVRVFGAMRKARNRSTFK